MQNISFYHLQDLPLEKALPKLLEKVHGAGHRCIVRCGNEEESESLVQALWTYTTQYFLPHGNKNDGFPERQPIYVTASDENPNHADILVVVDRVPLLPAAPFVLGFNKVLYMFRGKDPVSLEQARQRWMECKNTGAVLRYFQQDAKGGWQEKAQK